MDETLLQRLDEALNALAENPGHPPRHRDLEAADEDVLKVILAAAERAIRARDQVWALTETLVDDEMPLVIWPARNLHDHLATGEEAERADERLRRHTAESARNMATWRRERLQKVQEHLNDSQQRLEEQLQRVDDEVAAGPPPLVWKGW
ncbi:hypothetical protein [Streptomyces cinereoruber]|uniref:hypothetical protein n=1 Tax=Streptomyces cinereoruber TaxID=67260 RepID=UPI0036259960